MCGGWYMNSPETITDGFSGQMGMRMSEEEDSESERSKSFYSASSLNDFRRNRTNG